MAKSPLDDDKIRQWMVDFDNSTEIPLQEAYTNVRIDDFWKTLTSNEFNGTNIRSYFESITQEKREEFFRFGIACMCTFIQANFTGPELDEDIKKYLESDIVGDFDYVKSLAMNNEDINLNTKLPCLLVAAQVIFKECFIDPLVNVWWQWREILVYQKIMDELSPTLLANAENIKQFQDCLMTGSLQAQLLIEQAQLYWEFRHSGKADILVKSACEEIGLKYQLLGKLGKRTRDQESDIAQLTLEVNIDDSPTIDRSPVKQFQVPQNISLKDDVRLEKIKFVEGEEENVPFTDTEQKLLLILAHQMLSLSPQDELLYEELKPFIDRILSQDNTWCVRTCTLLFRCKLEAKHNRTIERSLMQCEEVVNAVKKEEPHVLNRVGGVFSTGLGPTWKVEEQYADLMLNLGLIKAALEVYLKLQLWEEVIVCYTILKMKHKAAEIIKQQIAINPSVKLYCLLGDATDDISMYEKAWEFSKRRSHRAQRMWGQYYFMRKKYVECIPHFEKSVSINPLQGMVWLRLGFAALETQNWQLAATAYRRYTTLEPDRFEAWNNLAQAYINLGNKRNAHRALLDALRCNFDNWKVWENFLVVSTDIGNYSDVIRAYHKLLDLKEKYLNIGVLSELVQGVCNERVDPETKGSSGSMKRTRELLGRVVTIYPTEGALWELYANLAPMPLLKIQRLQRAYRGFVQSNWADDVVVCKHVLEICSMLGKAVLDDSINPKDTVINSVRLNISSAISAIKKHDYADLKSLAQEVTGLLAKIIEKSKTAA